MVLNASAALRGKYTPLHTFEGSLGSMKIVLCRGNDVLFMSTRGRTSFELLISFISATQNTPFKSAVTYAASTAERHFFSLCRYCVQVQHCENVQHCEIWFFRLYMMLKAHCFHRVSRWTCSRSIAFTAYVAGHAQGPLEVAGHAQGPLLSQR